MKTETSESGSDVIYTLKFDKTDLNNFVLHATNEERANVGKCQDSGLNSDRVAGLVTIMKVLERCS